MLFLVTMDKLLLLHLKMKGETCQGVPNSIKGVGAEYSLAVEVWKILERGFVHWMVGICRGVILTITTFFKAKNNEK